MFWNWGCMFGRNFKLNTAYTWIHYYHSPACSAVHIINIHIQYHHTICVLKPDETTEKMNWKRNGDAAPAHRVLQLSILKHSLYFCCIKILHILKTGVILSWISHCMDRNTSRNHCLWIQFAIHKLRLKFCDAKKNPCDPVTSSCGQCSFKMERGKMQNHSAVEQI